jgi:spore coat protein U-like protein
MKKIVSLLSAIVVVAFVVSFIGGVAFAANNSTLYVNATVTGTCQFNTGASTLQFTLDPSSSSDAIATVVPTFWCTRGTTVTTPIATDNGLHYSGGSKRMMSAANPTEFIPYAIDMVPASTTGAGKSSPINLTINGTVLNANYVNALAADDYSDTVVITIAP